MESNRGAVTCRLPFQLIIIHALGKIEDHFVDVLEAIE
jgi:hypothetical protein